MKHIDDFKDFEFQLVIERLHINTDIDEYSDKIYDVIKNKPSKNKFEFSDLPPSLNISKLIINISKMNKGLSGELNLDKSKNTSNGWIIYINLKEDFMLYSLKHELNHALRLTIVGKDKMIRNLNHIKASNIFIYKNQELEKFFYLMYLANEEEINSKIIETYGMIKEVMKKMKITSLTKSQFIYLIKESDGYKQSDELINFKCEKLFKDWDNNKLNKLFYILEENKNELDRISGRFSKIKLLIKSIRDIFNNNTNFDLSDDKIYNANKDSKFYNRYLPSQGKKLRKRLYSLYDHLNNS